MLTTTLLSNYALSGIRKTSILPFKSLNSFYNLNNLRKFVNMLILLLILP